MRFDSTAVSNADETTFPCDLLRSSQNICEWTRIQVVNIGVKLPKKVMQILTANQLKWASKVQERHRRNEQEIENELKFDLIRKMEEHKNCPLFDDQEDSFNKSKELLEIEEGWVELKPSTSQYSSSVKKWINYIPPKKGERSIATGKVTGTVDCSAIEAAAWQFAYCSRRRVRESVEAGHIARIELKDISNQVNEATFAVVVRFPFPLESREFVFKQIWKSEEGKAMIAIHSVDIDKVDYGSNVMKLRGKRSDAICRLHFLASHRIFNSSTPILSLKA